MVAPKRLESLWDMLLNYAKAFSVLSADIEKARAQIIFDANSQGMVEQEMPRVVYLRGLLEKLVARCQQVSQLERMVPPIGRLMGAIDRGMTCSALFHDIENLQLHLFDELDRLKLYHVEEGAVPLYENEMPFGEQVFDRFPSAVQDSRNAGRCLALGQPTACMFHLMRVMERGLAAYAAKLGIPYAPSWEAYIRALDKQFSVEWDKKLKTWKALEPFHKRVLGDIIAVKTAWRNPTVHIINDYDREEALRAYFAVQGFMQNLAKKVREPGRRPKVAGA